MEDPDSATKKERLSIRLKDQTGEEVHFTVTQHTYLGKVFHKYAERKGVPRTGLRFLLDGKRLDDNETVKDVEIDDDTQIDVMIEQIGGW